MFQLSEAQAQDIVDKMMQDIPYNINIMNGEGIIVGSGTRERVGTVHQGAVKALATGSMVEVSEDGCFEKKGTNEPIVIDGERVGVIGITGDPEQVRPFCNLVRTTVSLLIEQRIAMERLALEANRTQAFLESLLTYHGAYPQKMRKEAAAYNIDLQVKTAVLYIRNYKPEERVDKLLLTYPFYAVKEEAHLLLMQNQTGLEPLIHQLTSAQPQLLIAVGRWEPSIADSYRQAKSAMNLLLALKPHNRTLFYEDAVFLDRLSHADLNPGFHAVAKLEDTPDLTDTLRVFINNNCSVTFTSAELNIHRNTLQYRLKRIEAITGKDPRNLLQLFELTHGLLYLHQSQTPT